MTKIKIKTKIKAKIGDGRFQWNFGGWFGGLIGGTAYFAVGSIVLAFQHPLLSAIWLFCFSAVVVFGMSLWMRRASLAPYLALQLLLLACGLSAAVAAVSVIVMAPNVLAKFQLTPIWSLSLLSMYPAMMLTFHFMENSARRKSQKAQSLG